MLLLPESQRQLESRLLQKLCMVQLGVLLPFTLYFPFWLSGALLFSPSWMLYRVYLKKETVIPRWLLMICAILSALAVYLNYQGFQGKEAGTALIIIMYSLKIFESKTYRDVNLLMILGFFIIALLFLFNQSFWMLVYVLLMLGLIIKTLIQANSMNAWQRSSWVSFKLLSFSLPIMLFLFFFFPRLSQPLWEMPGEKSSTGMSSKMQPGSIGELHLSDKVAFRVKFTNDTPDKQDFYWRGLVFEVFDGIEWKRNYDRQFQKIYIEKQPLEAFHYQLTLEPTHQNWLFGLDKPLITSNDFNWRTTGTFDSKQEITQRIRYQGISNPNAVLEKNLSNTFKRLNTALPRFGNRRSRAWAQQTYAKLNNAQAYVDFLLAYINNNEFYYTLKPPVLKEDIVDDFWLGKRKGFCEHYASSFVFLLRAANIPARVVIGYQGGQYNQHGNYWIIRQRNAHAWAEYWLPNKGWIRVDPTAAIAPERIEQNLLSDMGQSGLLFDRLPELVASSQNWLSYTQLWVDYFNQTWQNWIIDFDAERQWQFVKYFSLFKKNKQTTGLLIMVIVFFIVLGVALFIFRPQRSKDDVEKIMMVLLRKLKKKGYEKATDQGVSHFFKHIIMEQPHWAPILNPIEKYYICIRYQNINKKHDFLKSLKSKIKKASFD